MPDLYSEMLSFPAGKHDDQVDALSLLSRMLGEMQAPIDEKPKPTLEERVANIQAPTVKEIFDAHLKRSRRDD